MQNQATKRFLNLLNSVHYSEAFIQIIIQIIQGSSLITTYQQLHQLLKNQSGQVIAYFREYPLNQKLIQGKNPLCLQAINQYITRVIKSVAKKHGSDIEKFKLNLVKKLKDAIQVIKISTLKVASHAEQLFLKRSNRKVMVYSYSKSVIQALKKAHKLYENDLIVYACTSGPMGQGYKTYQQLKLDGINCQLIHDNEIACYIHQIGCVITGAEVVLENGSIINRSGTYLLALCAKQSSKHFYVFSESYKFVNKIFLCQKDIPQSTLQVIEGNNKNHVIPADFTPFKYISLFCTDIGIIPPQGVTTELNKRYH